LSVYAVPSTCPRLPRPFCPAPACRGRHVTFAGVQVSPGRVSLTSILRLPPVALLVGRVVSKDVVGAVRVDDALECACRSRCSSPRRSPRFPPTACAGCPATCAVRRTARSSCRPAPRWSHGGGLHGSSPIVDRPRGRSRRCSRWPASLPRWRLRLADEHRSVAPARHGVGPDRAVVSQMLKSMPSPMSTTAFLRPRTPPSSPTAPHRRQRRPRVVEALACSDRERRGSPLPRALLYASSLFRYAERSFCP